MIYDLDSDVIEAFECTYGCCADGYCLCVVADEVLYCGEGY